jgi:hypothetical protein
MRAGDVLRAQDAAVALVAPRERLLLVHPALASCGEVKVTPGSPR